MGGLHLVLVPCSSAVLVPCQANVSITCQCVRRRTRRRWTSPRVRETPRWCAPEEAWGTDPSPTPILPPLPFHLTLHLPSPHPYPTPKGAYCPYTAPVYHPYTAPIPIRGTTGVRLGYDHLLTTPDPALYQPYTALRQPYGLLPLN